MSFLNFVLSLEQQQAQRRGGDRAEEDGPSGAPSPAAVAAATAAPPRRPASRIPMPTEAPAPGGAAPSPAALEAAVAASASHVGPQLRALRDEQRAQGTGARETYSMDHVARLELFPPAAPYRRARANELCSKSHPQPCPYGCKTCHFCRQRTTESKSVCSRCDGAADVVGGPARGYWCGSCLWLRVGENLDEVRGRDDWVCPGCRGVCNCSGANCMRLKQGWFPTNQLAHEARDQGFRSVAHYLVLTNVAERQATAAIGAGADSGRRLAMSRQAPPPEGMDRPAKRQRTLLEVGGLQGRDAVLAAAAANSKLLTEVAAVLEELGGSGCGAGREGAGFVRRRAGASALDQLLGGESSGEAPGGRSTGGGGVGAAASRFLGILDADLMDDGDEGGGAGPSRTPAAAPLPRPAAPAAARAPAFTAAGAAFGGGVPEALPPRRPLPRARDTTVHEATSPPPPLAPLVSESEARLRRLVGGIDAAEGPHAGLPGAPGAAGMRAVPRGAGERAPRLAIPGWDLPTRRGPRQREDGGGAQQQRYPEEDDACLKETAMECDGGDSPSAAAAVTVAVARAAVTPELTAPPATAPADTTARKEPSTTAEEHIEADDGPVEALPETEPQEEDAAAVEAAAPAAQEEETALPAPPCTDAHTALAASAAALPPDAFAWNALCLRASGTVHDVHAVYRHHPDWPTFVGGHLIGAAEDVAMCEAAHDAGMASLLGVLRDAEALLGETAAVPAPDEDDGAAYHCAGALRTYAGLRKAVELLTYLARLLPEPDVRWRVERRLLGAEPFVEFGASDPSTRAILLRHALLELLAVLHRRGFPTRDAAVATSAALTTIARDLAAALPVLSAVKDGEALPESDFNVGPWRYDSNTRRLRRPIEIFQELGDAYINLSAMLTKGLQWVTDLCRVLGLAGAAFLTPELVAATLGPDARLTGATKKEALDLVTMVLDVASPAADASVALHMTGEESSARTAARAAVCDVLESSVVPALEAMVQRDFPLWGDRFSIAAASGGGDVDPAERVGGEKVEALARCYAFLVACGRLTWPAVEAKAARPHAFPAFWRLANAAYRHFATFLLAHALAHAPNVLSVPALAASALKVWTQALVDTGGRRSAWYLTSVLAAAAPQGLTSPLFAGLPPEALDIRGDVSGEKRAALAGHVARALVASLCQLRDRAALALGDLDALMAARLAEIERSAFDPRAAGLRYQAAAARVAVAVAAALAPSELMQGGRGAAGLGGLAGRLLRRAAEWSVAACVAAQADHSKSSGGSGSGGSGSGGDAEAAAALELADPLSTVADARQRLADSAFAQAPALLSVLLDAGAPEALERSGSGAGPGTPPPLLEALYVLLGGAIEAGSGAEKPSPVDTAMYEALADALGGTGGGDHPAPQRRQQLLSYVLGTFVRRYLQRSSLRHASHERAAVNALRLARAALAGTRSSEAARTALAPLLRPMLEVLSPDRGVAASLGCKQELYRLLTEVIAAHPGTVPPPVPTPPAPLVAGAPDAFPAALHAFWTAVCRDLLLTVSSSISREVAEERVRVAQLAAVKAPPGPLVLWPATAQSVAQASNDLLGALGRPRGLEALEKLYSLKAPGVGVPGPGGRAAPPQGPAPSFRTANVMWDAPRAAVDLLAALAALPGADGAAWALAAFHALHHLIPGSGASSQPLHTSYRAVRAALEAALGPQCTAAYPLAVARPPAPPAPAAQEQRPPNPAPATTAASEAPAAPPAAAARPQEPKPPAPQGIRIEVDQPLASLAALPLHSYAPVTALLLSATEFKDGAAVMAELMDFSGPGGEAVLCKLALGINTLSASRKALMSAASQPGAVLQVVRLDEVTVMRKAVTKYAAALGATHGTVVEVEPAGPRAEVLRRRQIRAPGVKTEPQSQQGECTSGARVEQRTESQTTRPAAPSAVKKTQPKLLDPVAAPLEAIARLEEMGYGGEAAEAAVRAAKAGVRWREQSMDEFLGAVLIKLL